MNAAECYKPSTRETKWMTELIPQATRFISLTDGFAMMRGGALYGARIGYEALGQLNADRDNVILILTGLSASAHVASHAEDPSPGWWEKMVGPGKPIDTDRWHVICVNSLGSCMGSTGPASINPRTGEPYRMDFPELSIEDISDAAAFTVRALGFDRVACVIGVSMGGMSSLALLTRHPGLAQSHINISGAVHSLPFAIAIRSQQREAIRTDPSWRDGHYDDAHYPERGMGTARKLGMIAYRSPQEWDARFGRRRLGVGGKVSHSFSPDFEIENYLDWHARKFTRRFDPNSFLYLSRSIDWFDVGDSFTCSADDALARVDTARALVLGVTADILFPIQQQQQIARGLSTGGADVEFMELDSKEGHDAFLIDIARFGPPVARFLSTLRMSLGEDRASPRVVAV